MCVIKFLQRKFGFANFRMLFRLNFCAMVLTAIAAAAPASMSVTKMAHFRNEMNALDNIIRLRR